jgi:anti-sigma B factor antagonist
VIPASPVALHIERTGGARTLRLAGEVDMSNAGALSAAIEPWLATDGDITLDLKGVVFMDSTGIGVLMMAAKQLGSRGILKLVSPGPLVNNVLDLIAADTLPNVQIISPLEEADEPPKPKLSDSSSA